VIGGGDWAADRLIPDLMRGASENKTVTIRNPRSTRPWQHVLESLSGYLLLGQKLLEGNANFAGAWNFGPDNDESLTVEQVADEAKSQWDKINFTISTDPHAPHEATFLKLDSAKAREKLAWQPRWNSRQAIKKTAEWYRNYYGNATLNTQQDIEEYGGQQSVIGGR
ncbi:MAG: hypothetical protein JW808_09770, partial [Victivallales bacterium]|nr:hypothetical protein [Victivallales bacterium]